ncbi:MAG: acyltransferase domain-containing protein [Fluviibacter sp.]
MRLAILFSGQGQQTQEHLSFLQENAGAEMSAELLKVLGSVWSGAEHAAIDLSTNVIAQPLIFSFEMSWWEKLMPYIPTPVCAAGYSLGEMAACSAAGLFSDSVGVALCHKRASLMDANTASSVSMLAVLGMNEDKVAAISSQRGLEIAIRNSPTHFVVTGKEASVNCSIEKFEAAGATKLTLIAVKTPSHTRFLNAASESFAKTLEPYTQGHLLFPVISAVTGKMSFSGKHAASALATQISSMLHWDEALETMVEMRPDAVLEIGPGNALSKMLGEFAPSIPVRSVCDFKSVQGVLSWLERFN